MKNIFKIILGTLLILLIPLVAMQFTSEVNWSLSDFVIMGVLLSFTGLILNLVWQKVGKYRALGVLVVLFAFLYIWAELAVGIFTNLGS